MWESHLSGRRIEQARFLLDVAKMHPAKVAQRLGVTEDALNHILGRTPDAQPDPPTVPRPSTDAGHGPVRALQREGL